MNRLVCYFVAVILLHIVAAETCAGANSPFGSGTCSDAHVELVGAPNRFIQKDVATGVEHESSGTSVSRPLEIMTFPPVRVFYQKRVGSVVQAAQTISLVHGTIDYSQ